MDITEEILRDHHEQRRLFAMIEDTDPGDKDTLEAIWRRLGNLLEVHAAAEEQYFYPRLLKIGEGATDADSACEETHDAIGDHNEIRAAVAAVGKHPIGSDDWFRAVGKANLANSNHMAEEERQGMADFRLNASLRERHDLARQFLTCKFRHLDGIESRDRDPGTYVREHSERAPAEA